MEKNNRLILGIAIGAATATIAFTAGIAGIIRKIITKSEIHLFDMSKQEGREKEVEDLIPDHKCDLCFQKCDDDCKNCKCPCRHDGCNPDRDDDPANDEPSAEE